MAIVAPSSSPESRAPAFRVTGPPALITVLLTATLVAILVANLPGFVCMPLDADVSLWDLFARTVSDGGVAYRDLLENNFPGMLWAHLGIRSLFGWRSEVIRAADAVIVAAIIVLLVRWLPAGSSLAWRLFAATMLVSFYLITSEWCHCQRDTWMLLPSLVALGLRWRQLLGFHRHRPSTAKVIGRGLAEGVLWGMAFWIKPYVAVPCICCWLVGTRQVLATNPKRWRWLLCDGAALLGGGLCAGLAGLIWLQASGALADFWDIMWVWNREYVHFNPGRDIGWLYYLGPSIRLAPWPLIHFAAVPIAVAAIVRRRSLRLQLLAAMYLGWLGQATFLQHVYDYIQVPALLLGIAVVYQQVVLSRPGLLRTLAVCVLLLGPGTRLPAVTKQRLTSWVDYFREGSSVARRDQLAILPLMNWAELAQVQEFLSSKGVRDGELTTLSMRTVPLYLQLGVKPASRYPFLENVLLVFARQRDRVFTDLSSSGQRFVVCDVITTRWRLPADSSASDGKYRRWPDSQSVPFPQRGLVFRAGRYAVFEVSASEMPNWVVENLEL